MGCSYPRLIPDGMERAGLKDRGTEIAYGNRVLSCRIPCSAAEKPEPPALSRRSTLLLRIQPAAHCEQGVRTKCRQRREESWAEQRCVGRFSSRTTPEFISLNDLTQQNSLPIVAKTQLRREGICEIGKFRHHAIVVRTMAVVAQT